MPLEFNSINIYDDNLKNAIFARWKINGDIRNVIKEKDLDSEPDKPVNRTTIEITRQLNENEEIPNVNST